MIVVTIHGAFWPGRQTDLDVGCQWPAEYQQTAQHPLVQQWTHSVMREPDVITTWLARERAVTEAWHLGLPWNAPVRSDQSILDKKPKSHSQRAT